MARHMRTDERTDSDLVAAALAGDRQAVADIYDRYSTVVFTVCVRLLGNRDDAADCAAEVFLRATERLHQLREPEKLKPWLYAIARNEVARRQRRRGREVPVEAIDELPWLAADDDVADVGASTEPQLVSATVGADRSDPSGASAVGTSGALERLLAEASAGLTDRDRAVAELGLRQNLQGDELADALGVTTNHAYVLVHRVRGRLERAVTAILVARSGRDDCVELGKILKGWDGDLTVLLRKRVSRHIDNCDICGERRKLVPAALFDAAPVLAAPIAVRHRVLHEAQVATATGRPWSNDGFPRASGRRRSPWIAGAAAVLAVLVLLVVLATGGGDSTVLAERSSTPATSSSTTTSSPGEPPSSSPSPSTTADPDLSAAAAAAAVTSTTGVDPTVSSTAPTTTSGGGGNVTPPPPSAGTLVVDPAIIDFGAAASGQGVVLTNTGGTALGFSLSSSSSHVTVSPSTGTVGPGGAQILTVVLVRDDLPDQFGATISGVAGGAPLSIPVSATHAQAPKIVSVHAPTAFGVIPNPACAVDVVATDNVAVTRVQLLWRSTLLGGSYTALDLTPSGGGHWTGELNTAPPDNVDWYVVARDAGGLETQTAPATTLSSSTCLP